MVAKFIELNHNLARRLYGAKIDFKKSDWFHTDFLMDCVLGFMQPIFQWKMLQLKQFSTSQSIVLQTFWALLKSWRVDLAVVRHFSITIANIYNIEGMQGRQERYNSLLW